MFAGVTLYSEILSLPYILLKLPSTTKYYKGQMAERKLIE